MKVEYISHMGTDVTVCNRARKSTDRARPEDAPLTAEDVSLIKYLARGYTAKEWDEVISRVIRLYEFSTWGEISALLWEVKTKATHFAPFTHPQVTFSVTAPLAIAMQLWKSHIGVSGGDSGYAAWSQMSRRYVKDVPDVFQPVWRQVGQSVKQGSGAEFDNLQQDALNVEYKELVEHSLNTYDTFINAGVAPEQARFALLESTMTTWDWTGSLMFWARLCWLRDEEHAQQEARAVARLISEHMAKLFPVSWEALMTGG